MSLHGIPLDFHEETVVLVDEENRVLGTMPKRDVHRAETPLHRAFSSYIFRAQDNQLLLQQRSAKKKTWPLVWSNSCCGHPSLGESTLDAARRRLRLELGLTPTWLKEVLPYRYCFVRDGVMENEICPILVGFTDAEPVLNSDEVEAVRWVQWSAFIKETEHHSSELSAWCIEQARLLEGTPSFKEFLSP